MNKPFFSIVIPTLNEELFLPKLLDSLCVQTCQDFEVIVSDGASTDKTVAIAHSYERRLPCLTVVLGKRVNASYQRNRGSEKARGEYILFIDADSVLFPYSLERIKVYIDRIHPKLFTTWFAPDSEVSGDALFTLIGNMYVEGSIVTKRPLAPGPLTIVSRTIFDASGGYDESITFGEDYDLTTRIVATGVPLQILRETLFVVSLRRVRREGKRKFIQLFAKASFLVLLTKRNLKQVPDYITGGHLYTQKPQTKKRASLLRSLERKIKSLTKELFE